MKTNVSHISEALTLLKVNVPDRRCRIYPEVLLVRRWVTWVLGIWRGEGWGRVEKGEVSLQAT
jgi:hypothetical protein